MRNAKYKILDVDCLMKNAESKMRITVPCEIVSENMHFAHDVAWFSNSHLAIRTWYYRLSIHKSKQNYHSRNCAAADPAGHSSTMHSTEQELRNYANPVYGVATTCHQVRWLRWGHPSLFHTATSPLIWYNMFCVREISYRLIWMEFINMFFVYAQSGTHSRFDW